MRLWFHDTAVLESFGDVFKAHCPSASCCLSATGRQHTMAGTEQQAGQGCLELLWLPSTLCCETTAKARWRAETSAVIPAAQANKELKSLLLPKDTESRSVQKQRALMQSTNYNCCPRLWGLHVGNRAKLGYPEAVLAAVLASSHPNKSSCPSQSMEVHISMATLFVSPFPSLATMPAVCLTCMQSCSTSVDRSFLSLFDISCFVLAVCTF